ncbi:MAG TPA: hypothetical protein VGJ15_09310 [Pirellulales bacterium]|jgi:hypothetical protein
MDFGIADAAIARQAPGKPQRLCGPIKRLRQTAAAFLAVVFAIAPSLHLFAADPSGKASTSRSARDEAARSIPLDKLSPQARSKVAAVLGDSSLFRHLPVQTVDCEPDLFAYVAANPDVMVNIWELMGVTSVTFERIDADHFRCSDGDGTVARVETVYRAPDMQIVYAEGSYDGPFFPKPVHGACIAVLRYTSAKDANGRFYETAKLDTFLHVDNVGVEFLAKVFQGLMGRTIDHNFSETILFMGSVSRTAEVNPHGMQKMISRLDQIDVQRRREFAAVSSRVPARLAGMKPERDDDNPALNEVIQSSAISDRPVEFGPR